MGANFTEEANKRAATGMDGSSTVTESVELYRARHCMYTVLEEIRKILAPL